MAQVTNTIQIHGPLEAVFDLASTTRFWPQWHPATTGVGGVTERPMLQGDKIRERAVIGGKTYEGNWTVVEHTRPARVVLLMESGRIKISYSFQASGSTTEFKRELEFHPEDFGASVAEPDLLEKLMHQQSEQALQKLKALVEAILQKETRLEIGD
ncbi:MAG: SRPBCC family protein [Anaerolineales bacterium]|nr:SRPBCC family protein [Anaerolineales bacterium]